MGVLVVSSSLRSLVFRSPEEFAEAAVTCLHPFDSTSPICDLLRENVFFTLVEGRLALAKARLDGVKAVAKVVSESASLDAECIASMDTEMGQGHGRQEASELAQAPCRNGLR